MSIRSSSSPAPLNVELRPSFYLRAALSTLALLVLLALARTALSPFILFALALLVVAATLLALRRHAGYGAAPAYRELVWNGTAWLWRDGSGQWSPLVLEDAVIWPGLLVLNFRCRTSRRRRALVLLADSAEADALRRLRVCLLHLPVFDV